MNLYVIDIFQCYVPVDCNCKCISGQMREVRGIIVNSADAAACPDHIPGINRNQLSFFIPDQNTLADIFAGKNITHFRVHKKRHVRQLFHLREKLARNLLSGYIVVEQDAIGRMCAFFRIAEFPVFIAAEIHTPGDELIDDISGRTDHNVDGFRRIFIVPGMHRIFIERIVIALVFQNTDTALCEEGVAVLGICFCYHQNISFLG